MGFGVKVPGFVFPRGGGSFEGSRRALGFRV